MTANEVPAQSFWDDVWAGTKGGDFWKEVAPEVVEIISAYPSDTKPDVLDLGCGLGRNTIAFARAGYRVTATDLSPNAVERLRNWADELGLKIETRVCAFTDEAFPPNSFDIVVSVNVLYHGLEAQFVQAVEDVRSWLRPGGVFYFTCPTLEDGEYGKGKQLAPHTFALEPGHIHYAADWDTLTGFLDGFNVVSCRKRDHRWEKNGEPQFSSRWLVLAEKQES
jgi:SAM-dependent methyltransferase